jgi:hypothetical protein
MKKLILFSVISASLFLLTFEASAQTRIRVRFPAGTHGTTIRGTVRGFGYRDYVVGAAGGQTMRVVLNATDDMTNYLVLAPDGTELEGTFKSNEFKTELPRNGNYVVRVMMSRGSARRKGSFSNFTLKINIK